jgi:hypothetical protein
VCQLVVRAEPTASSHVTACSGLRSPSGVAMLQCALVHAKSEKNGGLPETQVLARPLDGCRARPARGTVRGVTAA